MAKWGELIKQVLDVGLKILSDQQRRDGRRDEAPARGTTATRPRSGPQAPRAGTAPQPPRSGTVRTAPTSERARTIVYAPQLDGAADPGEIVWTWVPYEEDPRQGKDRPLLVVGRQGAQLLGLMLSSQGKRAHDPEWLHLGPGTWDREGRDSYVRLDRVLEVEEHAIRREGAVLEQGRFDRVATVLRDRFGWR